MRTQMVEQRIGENMGSIDWMHPTAIDKPQMWRDMEKTPDNYLFDGQAILDVGMYDGWPYWRPTPAFLYMGPLGGEWKFFNSYAVHDGSIAKRPIPIEGATQ